jgi:hypothetical protein
LKVKGVDVGRADRVGTALGVGASVATATGVAVASVGDTVGMAVGEGDSEVSGDGDVEMDGRVESLDVGSGEGDTVGAAPQPTSSNAAASFGHELGRCPLRKYRSAISSGIA